SILSALSLHWRFSVHSFSIGAFSLSSPLFFFSLTSCPPRSTLFPYTTLFRSQDPGRCAHRRAIPRDRRAGRPLRQRHAACHDAPDRKSTRLNSSHEWISYAVFCLKKKKKKY